MKATKQQLETRSNTKPYDQTQYPNILINNPTPFQELDLN